MKIHILYRDTCNRGPNGKNRPPWFSHDKCLRNILGTIEGIDFIEFHLIYDGKLPEVMDNRIKNIHQFNENSPLGSWIQAWNYAKRLELEDDDLVYFLENDYMHVPGWPHKVKELMDTFSDLNYITLYDHPDKYNPIMYPEITTHIFTTATHHWITRISTTGTFMVTKEILFEDYDIWVNSGLGDHHIFTWLGGNRQRNIMVAVPSLSTHCETEWLAPTINWKEI